MIAANRWWSSFFSKNKIIILYAKYQFSYLLGVFFFNTSC